MAKSSNSDNNNNYTVTNSADEKRKEDLEFLSDVSKRKMARPLAVLGLILIIGLVITTFILGLMGSELFIGFLFLSIMAPIFIYIFLWMGKLLRSLSNDKNKK